METIYDEAEYLTAMANAILDLIEQMNPVGGVSDYGVIGVLEDVKFRYQMAIYESEDHWE